MRIVVVLGAGASADFGLPLGGLLYRQTIEYLKAVDAEWRSREEQDPFWNYDRATAFLSSRDRSRVLLPFMEVQRAGRRPVLSIAPIRELIRLMEVAPAHSVDTLALESPEYAPILRTTTAQLIIEAIQRGIETTQTGEEIRQFDKNYLSANDDSQPNWIHLFCSMVRGEVSKNEDTSIGIVSFNYDRLFEVVGSKVWSIPSRDLGDFSSVFDVRYPHGKIAWETNHNGVSNFDVGESNIVFAHNKPDDYVNDGVAEIMEAAEKVIFLGFHFSPENIETLNLRNCSATEIVYQNFDGNRGLDDRVNKLGLENVRRFSGTISEAIQQGELGALPS